MLTRLAALGVVAALVLSACGNDDEGTQTSTGGSIAGTTWRLATLGGEPALADVVATLSFESTDAVTGTTGCNSFTGGYTFAGESISIGPLAITGALCEPEVEAQQAAFVAALELTASLTADSDSLVLLDADGTELATFDPFVQQLEGSSWLVRNYNDGQSAVSVIQGTELTADFGADGTVSGSAGCNSYGGAYEVDGDAVSIGPIAATEVFCAEPDGVMDQETGFLAALESAATFSFVGADLVLRTAADETAVTLTAPPGDAGPSATGADELVFSSFTGGGFVPVEVALSEFPELVVLGDGQMILAGPQAAVFPGPALPSLEAVPVSVEEVTALAADSGVFEPGVDFGEPNIADAPSTQVTALVDGSLSAVSVTAIDLVDDPLLTEAQQQARRQLSDLIDQVGSLGDLSAALPYTPPFWEVRIVGPAVSDEEPVPWPGRALDFVLDCALVEDASFAAGANQQTPWQVGGRTVQLAFRPMFPYEAGGCA